MSLTPEQCMKKCQAGTNSHNSANTLHAECYGNIGRLLTENERLKKYISEQLAMHIRQLNKQYEVALEITASYMMRYDKNRIDKENALDIVRTIVEVRAAPEDPIPL